MFRLRLGRDPCPDSLGKTDGEANTEFCQRLAFKEVTSDSPLQYLKKIRLSKARDVMVQHGMRASAAADRVGYESASQFSREFKRYFGQSPVEMLRELRAT